MAQVLGTLAVKLNADTAKFESAMKKAMGSLEAMGDRAKKVGAVAAAGLAAIGGTIALAIKASGEQTAAELKFAAAARASAEAIDVEQFKAFAATFQDLTGVADEATIAQSAFLVALGLNQDQLESAIPALSDFANVTGKKLPRIMRSLAGAIEGTASTLGSMGLTLSEAEKAAFNAGTRFEKTNLIIEAMGRAAPGLTAALKQTAIGGFGAVTGRIGDFLEQVGFLFDQPIGGFFNKMENAIKGVTGWLESLDDTTKQWVVRGTAMAVAISGIALAISGLILVLPTLIPLIAAVAGPFLVIALILTGLIALTGALKMAWEQDLGGMRTSLTAFAQNVVFEFEELSKKVDQIFREIEETFATLAAIVSFESPEEAFKRIQRIRERPAAGAGAIETAVAEVGVPLANAAKAAVSGFGTALEAGIDPFLKAFGVDIKDVGKVLDIFGGKTKKGGDNVAGLGEAALKTSDILGEIKPAEVTIAGEVAAAQVEQMMMPLQAAFAGASERVVAVIEDSAFEIAEAAKQTGSQFAAGLSNAFFAHILPAIKQGGENISAVIEGAAQGFQVAGPIGALIGAIAALLVKAEAFGQILQAGDETLGVLVEVLNLYIKPFVPLIKQISRLMGFTIMLSHSMGGLNLGSQLLGEAFEKISQGIFEVTNTIRRAFNRMIRGIANIIAKIPGIGKDLADRIRSMIIKTEGAFGQFEQDIEIPKMAPKLPDQMENFGGGLDKMTEKMNEATASLTNVPKGFKVALARFQAIVPGVGAAAPGEAGITGQGGGVNVENMTVDTTDPEAFVEMLVNVQEFKNFIATGGALGAGPFTVELKGAG